jgi:2-polyprenyl-6-methoxyphenol hydroxylase-like FAD-dependent oxidoreductase
MLAARAEGLRTLAVDARGPEARRSQLVVVRQGAQAALERLGMPNISDGRRTTSIRHIENRLRAELAAQVSPDRGAATPQTPAPLDPCWHTSVVCLDVGVDGVHVTLRDEATGVQRTVAARHVVDATGGRLESQGRAARQRTGPSHLLIAAEYAVPPWFEGVVGVRDPETQELVLLFPSWGRTGVHAYIDTPAGPRFDGDAAGLVQRFEAIAERLAMGPPRQPLEAIDLYQRALARPSTDRVVPVGDAVGSVDLMLGAGMSTAIEDGVEVARGIAAAQREASSAREMALTRALSQRVYARHRATGWRGRLMLALRPLLARAWPAAPLSTLERAAVGPPPLLWPAIRFIFGRRPKAAAVSAGGAAGDSTKAG